MSVPTLSENPATPLANKIIAASSPGGSILGLAQTFFSTIGRRGDHMTDAMREQARQLIRKNPAALRAMQDILDEAEKVTAGSKSNLSQLPTYGVPELMPAKRARGSGEKITTLAAVEEQSGICSYDVLQQTTEVLHKDCDQTHIVAEKDQRVTNNMPTGQWAALDLAESGTEVDGLTVIQRFTKEDVVVNMNLAEETLLSKHNKVVGLIIGGEDKMDEESKTRAIKNSLKFRFKGGYTDSLTHCETVTKVTPKIDGVPIQITTNAAGHVAHTRKGDVYEVDINGRYEFLKRKQRVVEMTIELYPDAKKPTRAFLIHVDAFGCSNNTGWPFMRQLLETKNIEIRLNGKRGMLLELPTFDTVHTAMVDGLVMHVNKRQFFVKPITTIDVLEDSTKRTLEARWNCKCEWKEGLWEYHVVPTPNGFQLTPARMRHDKTRENSMSRIEEVLKMPDYMQWCETLNDTQDPSLHVPAKFS